MDPLATTPEKGHGSAGDAAADKTADDRLAPRLRELARRTGRRYSAGHDRPLGGYLATMTGFGAYTAAWATAVRLRGRPLPDRPQPWDVVLTSVATFRLSRLLSKASVTSPLRAPFTRYVGPQGPVSYTHL